MFAWFRRSAQRPLSFRPTLEVLEDRLTPSSLASSVGIATTPLPQPPPTFFTAALELYIGGAELAFNGLAGLPVNTVQGSITALLPYAAPYGPLFVAAGEIAVYQTAPNLL
jgi:hypothetical protein